MNVIPETRGSTRSHIYLFIEDDKRVIGSRKSKKRDSKTLTKSKRQKDKQSTQHYTGNLRLRITNLSNKGLSHVLRKCTKFLTQ